MSTTVYAKFNDVFSENADDWELAFEVAAEIVQERADAAAPVTMTESEIADLWVNMFSAIAILRRRGVILP